MGLTVVEVLDVGLSVVGFLDVGLSVVGFLDVGLTVVGFLDVGLTVVGFIRTEGLLVDVDGRVGFRDVGLDDVIVNGLDVGRFVGRQ